MDRGCVGQHGSMRKTFALIGALLALGGIVLSLLSFHVRIPLGDDGDVRPHCSAPVASAWHRGAKASALN